MKQFTLAITKFFLLSLFAGMFLCSCKHASSEKDSTALPTDTVSPLITQTHVPNDSLNVAVKTFKENEQWGYDIFVNDKLYIHQPHIPSVMGNDGFSTEDNASRCGEFVAYKIRNNIMPPSVTPHELDSLGVMAK